MSEFSEYLWEYIQGRKLTWMKASQLCGVERTQLRRYALGKRMPEEVGMVDRIAEGLGMSKAQTREWKESYYIQKKGRYAYVAFQMAHRIFCGATIGEEKVKALETAEEAHVVLGQQKEAGEVHVALGQQKALGKLALIEGQQKALGESAPIEGRERVGRPEAVAVGRPQGIVKRLYGEAEICAYISYIAQNTAYLCLKLPPVGEGDGLFPIVAGVPGSCRIRHIVEMNHAKGKEAETEGLQKLLPFLFAKPDYQVYSHYHWQRQAAMEDGMHIALGEKGMVLYREGMGQGIFTGYLASLHYYREMFEEDLRQCSLWGGSQSQWNPCESGLGEGRRGGFWKMPQPEAGSIWRGEENKNICSGGVLFGIRNIRRSGFGLFPRGSAAAASALRKQGLWKCSPPIWKSGAGMPGGMHMVRKGLWSCSRSMQGG